MGGRVVRLQRGKPDTAKTYEDSKDPLEVARRWERQGASYLHVVDLDAATGRGENRETVAKVVSGVGIPVQVGGGIRSMDLAEEVLNGGAGRIIVATLAFERADVIKALLDEFGFEKVVVALDYLNGMVMTKGWSSPTGITLTKAMERFLDLGIELFLLTSISRDGLLQGPDFATLKALARSIKNKIFVAGGVNSLNDLIQLKSIKVDGVIIGKALYEGRFTLHEALNAAG